MFVARAASGAALDWEQPNHMNCATRGGPTVLTTAPLAEAWPAPADLRAFRARILQRAKTQIALPIADGITGVSLAVAPATTIAVLASPRARPHVDPSYPTWSALWVLQARGHRLGIADHVPANPAETTRRPLRSSGLTSLPLVVDSVVLFNAHRTHWMDAVPGQPRPVLFAASFDFSERPDRQTVEARILAAVVGA
jgi:hypothetical protein